MSWFLLLFFSDTCQGNHNSSDESTPVLGQTFLEQGADEQAISEAALNKLLGTAETFDLEVTMRACRIVWMFSHAAILFCKHLIVNKIFGHINETSRKRSLPLPLSLFLNHTKNKHSFGCLNWRRELMLMKKQKLLIPVGVPTILQTSMLYYVFCVQSTECWLDYGDNYENRRCLQESSSSVC